MTARSVSDLAADVTAGASFYMAHRGKESPHPDAPEITVWEHALHDPECPGCKAESSLDELVAWLEAAEAQVAALTHRLEDTENARAAWQTSCKAAEAALADLRRQMEELREQGLWPVSKLVVALADTRRALDEAWIGSQIALCEEFIRAAKNDETFGVEDIEAKLILLTQAER